MRLSMVSQRTKDKQLQPLPCLVDAALKITPRALHVLPLDVLSTTPSLANIHLPSLALPIRSASRHRLVGRAGAGAGAEARAGAEAAASFAFTHGWLTFARKK